MKGSKIAKIAAAYLLCTALPLATFAQGIGEMGSVYSSGAGQAGALHGSGLGNALKGLYGGSVGTAGGGRQPQMDEATAATYAADANQNYLRGLAAQKAGKTDDALKFFKKSVETRERIWGSGDPAIVQIANLEANIYEKRGDWAETENCYRKILLGQVHQFGPNSPKLEKTISKICWLCEKQDKTREVGALFKQLADIKMRQPKADIADVKRLQLKSYEAFTTAHDFATAEALLKVAMSKDETDSAYTAKLMQCYAKVLRGTDRTNAADEMDAKAKSLLSSAGASVITPPTPGSATLPATSPAKAPDTVPAIPSTAAPPRARALAPNIAPSTAPNTAPSAAPITTPTAAPVTVP